MWSMHLTCLYRTTMQAMKTLASLAISVIGSNNLGLFIMIFQYYRYCHLSTIIVIQKTTFLNFCKRNWLVHYFTSHNKIVLDTCTLMLLCVYFLVIVSRFFIFLILLSTRLPSLKSSSNVQF